MCNKIKSVSIIPGCISCGSCESICNEVFEIDGIAHVKKKANFDKYDTLIREAKEICPVNAIVLDEE